MRDPDSTDEQLEAHDGVLGVLRLMSVLDTCLSPDQTRLVLIDGCDGAFSVGLHKGHVARLIAELQALHDQMPEQNRR